MNENLTESWGPITTFADWWQVAAPAIVSGTLLVVISAWLLAMARAIAKRFEQIDTQATRDHQRQARKKRVSDARRQKFQEERQTRWDQVLDARRKVTLLTIPLLTGGALLLLPTMGLTPAWFIFPLLGLYLVASIYLILRLRRWHRAPLPDADTAEEAPTA